MSATFSDPFEDDDQSSEAHPRIVDGFNVGDAFSRYRARSDKYYDLYHKCQELASKHYRHSEIDLARQYNSEAKQWFVKAEKEKRDACNRIFEHNNREMSKSKIDLHGLFVKESNEKLVERLGELIEDDSEEILTVVVGRGLHSKSSPKIKAAVIKLCHDMHFSYEISSVNEGVVYIYLQ